MSWGLDKCIVKDCPLVKEEIPIVFQREDFARIKALLKKYKEKEWLLYLYGEVTNAGVEIARMSVPSQEVSGGSVDQIEAPLPGCIGTIHSHNNMGAFHSATDETYIQANHRVCITVNNKLEFAATVDITSECGRPMRVKAEILITEPEVNLDAFLKEAEEKIKEYKYQPYIYPGYSYEYNEDNSKKLGGQGKDERSIAYQKYMQEDERGYWA